jgi:hypothetical protein
VGIGKNPLIHRDQIAAEVPCCGDNDLISGISVKLSRQATRIGSDIRSEFKELYTRISECSMKPLLSRHGQSKAPALDKFRNFPAGDCADAYVPRFVLCDERLRLRRKPIILVNPPDPDMRVEDDHRVDSQSPSATLSNGPWYSTFIPLSG